MDPTLPGLDTVIDRLVDAVSVKHARSAYEREISRATDRASPDLAFSTRSGTLPVERRLRRPGP